MVVEFGLTISTREHKREGEELEMVFLVYKILLSFLRIFECPTG